MFIQRSHAVPASKTQVAQRQGKNRNSRFFQAKLSVNAPGDEYEQEADTVADKVMRMTASDISPAGKKHGESPVLQRTLLPGMPGLQRKCAECEQDEKEQVQRKETGASSGTAPSIVSSVLNSGGGRPLDKGTRQFMESRFGQDFGQVRIHTGSQAAESAEAIRARAYTSGRNIVFGSGEYQPGNVEGKRLLAHELVHVGQQGNAPQAVQRLIRTPYPWRGIITPSRGANIRSSPDSTSRGNLIGSIPRGQPVRVLSNSGNWLYVESRYTGTLVTGYIYHTLVDDATSFEMQSLVGSRAAWTPSGRTGMVGSTAGNDFADWASASSESSAPSVSPGTTINCWEMILLAAYRTGALSWRWIHHLYISVPMSSWPARMTRGGRRPYIPGTSRVPRGNLVFFNGVAHVALATGTGEQIYTFWPPPDFTSYSRGTVDEVKIRTISSLTNFMTAHMGGAPVVEHGAPAW